MKNNKFNCYKCEHRGTVPGDAHSCCQYPGTATGLLDFFNDENSVIAKKLNIKGNPHGIKFGWFFWPINFDPTWLESCEGFNERN